MVGMAWSVGLGVARPPSHGGLWGALSRDRAEQLMAGLGCLHSLPGRCACDTAPVARV